MSCLVWLWTHFGWWSKRLTCYQNPEHIIYSFTILNVLVSNTKQSIIDWLLQKVSSDIVHCSVNTEERSSFSLRPDINLLSWQSLTRLWSQEHYVLFWADAFPLSSFSVELAPSLPFPLPLIGAWLDCTWPSWFMPRSLVRACMWVLMLVEYESYVTHVCTNKDDLKSFFWR